MSGRRERARERLELRFARTMTSLPPRVVRRLAGPAVVIDGQRLNPQLQLILKLRAMVGAVGATDETPERSRSRLLRETRTFAGLPLVGGPVRDFTIPGPAGPIPVRHYDTGDAGPRPLLVFFHGGGHVIGDLDTHDQPCRILCRHAGVHVLSVEYRKAPEDPFPAAPEDCLAAYGWAREHARELGADGRVAVAGDSAGGNLAAVVAGLAADRGEPPALQLLIYPGLERDQRRPSMDHFRDGFFLTEADIDWFFGHYAGDQPAKQDPRLNPMAHQDRLHQLPPTIVVTAGFDPLRDEGEWYVEQLREAGVPVMLRRFHDLSHGIVNMTGVSSACYDAVVEMAGMLRAALDLPAQVLSASS